MLRLQILNSVGYVRPLKTTNHVDSAKSSEGNGSSPENASSANQPEPYEDAPSGKFLEILRVRNRFAMETSDPHWSGGFRDMAFKVKVGFKVLLNVAVSSSDAAAHSKLSQPP